MARKKQTARKSTGGKAPRRQLLPDISNVFASPPIMFKLRMDELRRAELSYTIRTSDPTWVRAHGEPEFRDRWIQAGRTMAIRGEKLDDSAIISVLNELESHAAFVAEKQGLQPTACYHVYQSDEFLSADLQHTVLEGIRQLGADNDNVLKHIVDPNMYCFVSGQSKMRDLSSPEDDEWLTDSSIQYFGEQEYMWISTPFRVGGSGLMEAMSPINNVHPDCKEAYHAIEEVVSASTGMFNQVFRGVSGHKISVRDCQPISIVVEVFRISLDVGRSNMDATDWSAIGGKEDDIVASTLYCAQSENIIGGDVCFRAPVDENCCPVSTFSPDFEASVNELKELYGVGT